LVAGTKYRGEFEEKLHKLVEEIIGNPHIILFIDEIHTLMGAGGAEGAIDASNILKPYLARGDIKVIGATTTKEYNDFIHKDKALDRRFQKIYIEEANREEVQTILEELKPIYENFHGVVLSKEILSLLIDLSFSCLFFGKQPDKAIDYLDEVCSYVSFSKNKRESRLISYHQQIYEIERLKNEEIKKKDFEKALFYREKENDLKSHYNRQLFSKRKNSLAVEKEDLYEVIYQKVRCYRPSDWKRHLHQLKRDLKRDVIGQKDVIEEIIQILAKYDYIQNKDCMTLLFVGKSGVGKTFLVEKIVNQLFHGVNTITLNMSEYRESYMISKLVGTAPGYVGYQDTFLFQSIQENPFSVLVLDDIDKANPILLQELLDAFSSGYIMNNRGEKIILSKCIVFMTGKKVSESIGFQKEKEFVSSEKYAKIKHVFSLHDVDEDMIRTCLKHQYSQIDENLKRRNLLKEGLETDWKDRGFHAICDFLEKETV